MTLRIGGLAAALALGAAAGRAAEAGYAPVDKLVLISIDTLRADHVGVYGGPVPTPAIDRLAAEGVLVEQAFTPIASTGPAHVSLMTGLHPWRHGTLSNAVPVDPRIPTLAEVAAQRGMATAGFVSSFILSRRFGFHQGFETFVFEPSQEYEWRQKRRGYFWTRGEITTRSAIQWITAHADRPFFVWVHYFDPHTPYQPPPGYSRPADEPVDLTGKHMPVDQPIVNTERELRSWIRAYRGEVAYSDAQVGTLVDRLRMLGILDRTAVILTSDHGEGLGDHALMEHGLHLFEELIHVPLVIRAPGLPAGRRLSGAAQLEDLQPTIRALIGAEVGGSLDGKNLLPWLRGEVARSPRDAVFGRRDRKKARPDLFYFRRWPDKWIGPPGKDGLAFSLDRDPDEAAGTPGGGMPEVLREKVARAEESGTVREGEVDPDPEVRRALEALGYLDD